MLLWYFEHNLNLILSIKPWIFDNSCFRPFFECFTDGMALSQLKIFEPLMNFNPTRGNLRDTSSDFRASHFLIRLLSEMQIDPFWACPKSELQSRRLIVWIQKVSSKREKLKLSGLIGGETWHEISSQNNK